MSMPPGPGGPPGGGGGPPGGGGGGGGTTTAGESDSTACTVTSGNCAFDGKSNYHDISGLTYNLGTFSGDFITNQCAAYPYGECDNCSESDKKSHSADCISQEIYHLDLQTAPSPTALRGRVGFTVKGVNIYGPMEAGFTAGQASCQAGSCEAGLDVPTCEAQLEYQCEGTTDGIDYSMLPDDCNGHALPYHIHGDTPCDYDSTATGHSTLVGVALDGRGIYGRHESTGAAPTGLDACGGHEGPVPSNAEFGITAENVYHYHLQDTAPYSLGCFGPVDDVDACKALYPECGTGYTIVYGEGDNFESCDAQCYDTDCPCFDANGRNNDYTVFTCPGVGLSEEDCDDGDNNTGGDGGDPNGGNDGNTEGEGDKETDDLNGRPKLNNSSTLTITTAAMWAATFFGLVAMI